MANFIPSYKGLKIDLQSASKEDLLKEARRLSSNVKRRIEKFNRLDIKTHEIDVLETRRNEILGNNYKNNITTISKNFTEGQLRATISAYDKYFKSKYRGVVLFCCEGTGCIGKKSKGKGNCSRKKCLLFFACS